MRCLCVRMGKRLQSIRLSIRNLINRHISQLTLPQIGTEVIAMSGYQCTALYQGEVTQKYQKRFLRYRDSLFRFLEEDGIPWNNNMAERAIRHLAVQRKISG